MGDEIHNRSDATALLLFKELTPSIVRAVKNRGTVCEVLDYLAAEAHHNFGARFNMGASKVALMAAEGVEFSTLLTVMSRNGVETGIKVSGLDGEWFTGSASHVEGTYFAGYDESDACPDLGDSAITETAGWGGFACAAAPTMAPLAQGSLGNLAKLTLEMYAITAGRNAKFTIPYLDFQGVPIGIDMRKVIQTGIRPLICTAVAHKDFGIGRKIGIGFARPPMEAFEKALRAFVAKYAIEDADDLAGMQ
jgi:hypothetical protein